MSVTVTRYSDPAPFIARAKITDDRTGLTLECSFVSGTAVAKGNRHVFMIGGSLVGVSDEDLNVMIETLKEAYEQ